jgi:hypothetical protein
MRAHGGMAPRLILFSFACAFVSLLSQVRGLYGREGLTPFTTSQEGSSPLGTLLGTSASLLGLDSFSLHELLLLIGSAVTCVASSSSSSSSSFSRRLAFPVATALYLLTFSAATSTPGSPFLSFQWDILLLEAGYAASLAYGAGSSSGAALLRFLAVKLLFLSGWTKIDARCPEEGSWGRLTALEVHFASQCIPSPVAAYLHALPPGLLRLATALTLWLELPATLLLLAPTRTLARLGSGLQIALQLLILASGSYNFFNLLTIAILLAACGEGEGEGSSKDDTGGAEAEARIDDDDDDDDDESRTGSGGAVVVVARRIAALASLPDSTRTGVLLQLLLTAVYSGVTWNAMFTLATTSDPGASGSATPWWDSPQLRVSDLVADSRRRGAVVAAVAPWVVGAGLLYVVIGAARDLAAAAARGGWLGERTTAAGAGRVATAPTAPRVCAGPRLLWAVAVSLSLSTLSLSLFAASAVSFTSALPLDRRGGRTDLLPRAAYRIAEALAPYHVASSFGLFRCMTGVGPAGLVDAEGRPLTATTRPEVVLEGLWDDDDGGGDGVGESAWREIHFRYKPTDVAQRPPWVWPHQPRLDWQMWFAALAPSYAQSPFTVHLAALLADGSPAVLGLLDTREGVWPVSAADDAAAARPAARRLLVAPLAVRARLYRYDFERIDGVAWGTGRFRAAAAPLYRNGSGSGDTDGAPGFPPAPHPAWAAAASLLGAAGRRGVVGEGRNATRWWRREAVESGGHVYLPPIMRGNAGDPSHPVHGFLAHFGWDKSAAAVKRLKRGGGSGGTRPGTLSCGAVAARSAKAVAARYGATSGGRTAPSSTISTLSAHVLAVAEEGVAALGSALAALPAAVLLSPSPQYSLDFEAAAARGLQSTVPLVAHTLCEASNLARSMGLLASPGFVVELPSGLLAVQPPYYGSEDLTESPWWILLVGVAGLQLLWDVAGDWCCAMRGARRSRGRA